ncbi:MAG: Imm74 family immunity protein [Carnobacterium sp.]
MKITGTKSYIRIEIDGKTLKIEGEMIVGGFVAYKNSITNWDSPYETQIIDEDTKNEIVQKVIETTKDTHMVISFE